MTDQKNALAALFFACSRDEALKARFMNDPRAVLMEHGVDVPEDREIRVVENTHDCHHLTLPLLPSAMLMMFEAQTRAPDDRQASALAELFAACCRDEALKRRFIENPGAMLREHGIDVPEGLVIKVIENTDDHVHITLPKAPSDELSDEDLLHAVGGYQTVAKTGARSL